MKLSIHLNLTKDVVNSPNLCDLFTEEDLNTLGSVVWQGYRNDLSSRVPWERRTEAAMKLALQVVKTKTFPWPDCSNIAFPLVSIAALQFHARAYSACVQGNDLVKCRITGQDPTGEASIRANRISRHMSYQFLEQDEEWEEGHDRLLMALPIIGCAFKKTYSVETQLRSEFVYAHDLVVDYYAKSVEKAYRKTHIIPLSQNAIMENIAKGMFRDVTKEGWFKGGPTATPPSSRERVHNDISGTIEPTVDEATPFRCLEQHVWFDLDGDGYSEPYIVTIEENSHKVLRIVTRFNMDGIVKRGNKLVAIQAEEYFTKYSFIPSPDGGIYDIGWGVLLGPLNESTNSIINQIVDAGTLMNTAGGFISSGVKMHGGAFSFSPFKWNRVQSSGDDLAKGLFPLPIREPSAVLYQLLGFLVNYIGRVSATGDVMVGENPGQNTPAYNMQAMQSEGQKVYNDIFKRIWRSMKKEFKKGFILNGIYLPDNITFGDGDSIAREDYLTNPNSVVPVADPYLSTDNEQIQKATAVKQAAGVNPKYNADLVEQQWLRALKIDGIDQVYQADKQITPPEDKAITIQKMKSETEMSKTKYSMMEKIIKIMSEVEATNAKILLYKEQAALAAAEADGVPQGHMIAAYNAAIGAMKEKNATALEHMKLMMTQIGVDNGTNTGGLPGMESQPSDTGGTELPSPESQGLTGGMV